MDFACCSDSDKVMNSVKATSMTDAVNADVFADPDKNKVLLQLNLFSLLLDQALLLNICLLFAIH